MLIDTAVHTPPLNQVCWQVRAEDYSELGANWCRLELGGWEGEKPHDPIQREPGSQGVESRLDEWPQAPDEWRSLPRPQPSPKEVFVPRTELGRKLWALRQKSIAEGGRLYTMAEIQQEVARRRGELE